MRDSNKIIIIVISVLILIIYTIYSDEKHHVVIKNKEKNIQDNTVQNLLLFNIPVDF